MSGISLDPEVADLLDSGDLVQVDLAEFRLDSGTRRFWRGRRRLMWNTQIWEPNVFMSGNAFSEALGNDVQSRTIVFAGVPVGNPQQAIWDLEDLNYQNRVVVVHTLAAEPTTGKIAGLLVSHVYEIDTAEYDEAGTDSSGRRTMTINVRLEPPGRSARSATRVKRSLQEQQFDNDPDDTGLEYVAVVADWPVEWGSVQ